MAAYIIATRVGLGVGVLLGLASTACRTDTEAAISPAGELSSRTPVPGRHLDRAVVGNAGLIAALGPDGVPLRDPGLADPLVVEARRFYDTLGAPGAAVQSVDYPDPFGSGDNTPRTTAPLTLDSWKATFGFPPRQPNEATEAYRRRLGVVVYYNRNELGLGRELGCADFVDGADAAGTPLIGLACFVTNYGATFRDERNGLAMALEGGSPRNTVCITYRPSMEPGYQVQFYTYGGDGRRQEWAQLDSMGPRPHPQVCINCHGGSYDQERHLARNARFLPLDPNMVAFTADVTSGHDRTAQEESIRRMNAASLRTPLTPAQRELLQELYPGGVETPGVVSGLDWVAAGWKGSAADSELFSKVVKPYCTTCHLAIEEGVTGSTAFSYHLLRTATDFRSYPMTSVVCGTFSMPNAQPTILALWDNSGAGVTLGAQTFPSAADALLTSLGADRSRCGLEEMGTCNRGPDPDALCGNATSGMACNRVTGRCAPELGPLRDPASARGYCRLDGTRSCPATLVCRLAELPMPAGLESFDGTCVRP